MYTIIGIIRWLHMEHDNIHRSLALVILIVSIITLSSFVSIGKHQVNIGAIEGAGENEQKTRSISSQWPMFGHDPTTRRAVSTRQRASTYRP